MTDAIIWQSTRNIMDSSAGFEALWEGIERLILKGLADKFIEQDDSAAIEKTDWASALWVNYFKLRKSGHWKAKTVGWISIGFQQTSDTSELEWEHGKRTKVLVGYVGSDEGPFHFGTDFPNVGGEAEDMDEDGGGVRYYSDGLRWQPVDAPEWFFAIPLNSLENDSAIQRLIVHPLKQMIDGATSEEALGPFRGEICVPPDHQRRQVS